MKSVRISDEAYKKIIKRSKKDKRTITATIDIMIDESIANESIANGSIANGSVANGAATFNTSPYSPVDCGSESDPDVERKPVRRAETKDMTVEEMMEMNQRTRNKSYYNQAMSDEE